ncbi:hypothetical protein [Azospirillum sp. sgz302134]
MSKGRLDHETLQAVGVLMRAVEQARVPGVLEFRLLTDALGRAVESARVRDLEDAKRIFDALDSEFRARIVLRANEMARVEANLGERVPKAPTATAEPPRRRLMGAPLGAASLGKAVRSATGFLAALNGARGAAAAEAEPDSRATAKSRLKAAVEERREAELAAATLRAGEPLPRATWTS